jgi:hypothetical protein
MAAVPAWVSLVTAALGGGVISGGITFILETKRSEKNLLRTKLEELHTAFDRSSRKLSIIHELLSQYAKGESDIQGFLKESTSYVEKFSEPTTERVSALCAIYFPELTICYKSFTRARERFTDLMEDRITLVSRPEGFESAVEESYEFLKEMDEVMRKAIYRCAANINLAWTSRLLNKMRFLGI